jgi:hypothetical protein
MNISLLDETYSFQLDEKKSDPSFAHFLVELYMSLNDGGHKKIASSLKRQSLI